MPSNLALVIKLKLQTSLLVISPPTERESICPVVVLRLRMPRPGSAVVSLTVNRYVPLGSLIL